MSWNKVNLGSFRHCIGNDTISVEAKIKKDIGSLVEQQVDSELNEHVTRSALEEIVEQQEMLRNLQRELHNTCVRRSVSSWEIYGSINSVGRAAMRTRNYESQIPESTCRRC